MISPPLLARFALEAGLRLRLKPRHRLTKGFTLIEALIAIVIVSVTLVSITPPIFLATATRVQNRRAQQAQQIAQGEVDRVRLLVERQQTYASNYLPALSGSAPVVSTPPPSGTLAGKTRSNVICTGATLDDGTAPAAFAAPVVLFVDVDADCKFDFIVQTFRGGEYRDSATLATSPPDGFTMGVRVYSSVAANTNVLSRDRANLRATNGLGNQTSRPLAVLYVPIVRNNSSKSLDIYRCTLAKPATAAGCDPR
jgi:prepilin-type N-terminal cleavage/methylation domain-containing protein